MSGDYIVFLDNDIETKEGWLEHLVARMESDPKIAACCCRVLFPNGEVQFCGGGTRKGAERIRFDLLHTGKSAEDLSTLEEVDCDWVPGGATIFRRDVLEKFPYDTKMAGAYEDNDWSIRVREAGYRLVNAPLATVIHHHLNFNPAVKGDKHYIDQRYNKERLEKTLVYFYRKHGLFIDEEDLYTSIGYKNSATFMEKHRRDSADAGF